MKKKLVVLLMASSMALAACGGQKSTAATIAETTAAETVVEESTDEDTAGEDKEGEDESDTDADPDGMDAIDLSEFLATDMKTAYELIGIDVEEKDGKYFLSFPAEFLEGLSPEEVEEAVTADSNGDGIVSVNEDGSAVLELTAEQYTSMEEAYAEQMSDFLRQ